MYEIRRARPEDKESILRIYTSVATPVPEPDEAYFSDSIQTGGLLVAETREKAEANAQRWAEQSSY